MNRLFLISFILILLIPSIAASSYNVELNQIDNKLLVKHSISLNSPQNITLTTPQDAVSISANAEYSQTDDKLFFQGKEIEISYITRSALEKSAGGYYLITKILFPFSASEANIKLILKEGYFLDKEKLFPKPSIIETDGKQISLSWNLKNVVSGDDLPIFLAITSSSGNSGTFWVIISLALVALAYIIYRYSQRKPSAKKEDIDKYLIDSEKAVISILKQADRGEMWQKQLQLKTNFSKAKLSRVIRNLESRNLVEKIPFGNTNKVRLK